jgi:hypothetical protein
MYDVFVSHASEDKRIAWLVVAALEEQGIPCWIALRNVTAGDSYAESIVKAIRSCPLFLLIYSAKANDSKHVLREVERAVNAEAAIITFRIEDVVPSESMEYFISSQHWLDAYEPPVERHIAALVDTVTERLHRGQRGTQPSPRKPSSATTRSLVAKLAFGKLGCALTVTLLGLFVAVLPFSMMPMPARPPNSAPPNDFMRLEIEQSITDNYAAAKNALEDWENEGEREQLRVLVEKAYAFPESLDMEAVTNYAGLIRALAIRDKDQVAEFLEKIEGTHDQSPNP